MAQKETLAKGQKGIYGRSSKKPTVGRDDDLPWVALAIYCRFYFGGIGRHLEGVAWRMKISVERIWGRCATFDVDNSY